MRKYRARLITAALLATLLVVAVGCATAPPPDVAGMDIAAAEKRLLAEGFELGHVRYDSVAEVEPNTVIGQWIASDSSPAGGRRIDVTVARALPTAQAKLSADSASVTVRATVRPRSRTTMVSLQGSDRYATAVEVSRHSNPNRLPSTGSKTVVVATGENWPDALGGSALAGVLGGPMLLVRTNSIPPVVTAEITRLGAERAIILGGTRAVGQSVLRALERQLGAGKVTRLSGKDRYATADLVAQRVVQELGTRGGFDGTVLVATGENFPDSLAGASLAAARGWPLLLAHPRHGLFAGTRANLSVANRAIILGGRGAVSRETEEYLAGRLGHARVTRIGGIDRYHTAAEIARTAVSRYGMTFSVAGIATGENFPDALAGGVMQGKSRSATLLTPGSTLSRAARDVLTQNRASIRSVVLFGGPRALGETVRSSVSSIVR